MPRGDGTGPNGQGPMTGRGIGYCAGFNAPGFMSPGFGRGLALRRGFGRGMGRGFRWRTRIIQQVLPEQLIPIQQVPVQFSEAEEKNYLQEELTVLKQEMQEIEARLKELSKKK